MNKTNSGNTQPLFGCIAIEKHGITIKGSFNQTHSGRLPVPNNFDYSEGELYILMISTAPIENKSELSFTWELAKYRHNGRRCYEVFDTPIRAIDSCVAGITTALILYNANDLAQYIIDELPDKLYCDIILVH